MKKCMYWNVTNANGAITGFEGFRLYGKVNNDVDSVAMALGDLFYTLFGDKYPEAEGKFEELGFGEYFQLVVKTKKYYGETFKIGCYITDEME